MSRFTLDREQRYLIEDLVSQTDNKVIMQRAQALLWLDEGESVARVAQQFQVTRQAVYKWVKKFQYNADPNIGVRLQDSPRSGRPAKVKGVIDPIIRDAISRDPRTFGFEAPKWTAGLLTRYLNANHGLSVSVGSVRLALSRLGLRWHPAWHQSDLA